MAKDPAALFFIANWLTATKEMKADCRGWYLNLILHQFDKNDLPNDVEELANLADVRVSEYEKFKQVFEQVLKHKFEINPAGRLENGYAKTIITGRESFKGKRSNAGKVSYFLKVVRKVCKDEDLIEFAVKNIDFNTLDCKNKQMVEQVFKQTSELYINTIINNDSSHGIVLSAENKNQFPGHDYEMDLSDVDIGACIQFVLILTRKELTPEEVKRKFKAFKLQNFTGKKFYQSKSDIISHFRNWLKFQKADSIEKNGTTKNQSRAATTSASANFVLDSLQNDLINLAAGSADGN